MRVPQDKIIVRMLRSVIAATGSHIPPIRVPNSEFLHHDFRAADGSRIHKTNEEIVQQFDAITGIKERRYVAEGTFTSDIAYAAANEALTSSGIDRESLDVIIVAHNFGDVHHEGGQPDLVPSLAARVKARLRITKPNAAAFDLIFGCPGWIQGVITPDPMIPAADIPPPLIAAAAPL